MREDIAKLAALADHYFAAYERPRLYLSIESESWPIFGALSTQSRDFYRSAT